MFDALYTYLNEKIDLSTEDTELIGASVSLRKLRRNQYLLQEGDVCQFVAFVSKGCLRTYRVDPKGKEHIIYFAVENWWAGDRESYLNEKPSSFYVDAVEASEVIMFHKSNFEMLCTEIPEFGGVMKIILPEPTCRLLPV
ncbi:Cyclic nucleotide-binding domain-containing protein [Pedobacter westerhofensis]|uniref:Cyclic nucleotide-binding domain-containing protein n=1 Tax=Pedobacter westerhofensis TaxID=425512 RepID=A0A521EAN0_9SPHI|nr:Crp/Fnr family transcriptional regulator [Pedobacter westerhofensis]SMO80842.1 Cyclic nucleotide-binding domain-containing protein [Pedobacter westerhofensis]